MRGPCNHKLEIKGTFKTLLQTSDCATEEEMNAHIDSIIAAIPASDPKLSQISKAQDQDKICQQVKKYCAEN